MAMTEASLEKTVSSKEVEEVAASDSSNEAQPPGEERVLTWKLALVIFILSSTFGLSFFPVPVTAALQAGLATKFGKPLSYVWYVPAYTTGCSLGFLLAGANSDIFGRRIFLLFGHVTCCVGYLITATAKGSEQFTAGLAICGFGAGFCQMAMCAIPELMPNKYRHIGICISDGEYPCFRAGPPTDLS